MDGAQVRQITHDFSFYVGARAGTDGKTLVAKQIQYFVTLEATTPGKELESKNLSVGNQAYDGSKGIASTPDGKIVYTSFHNQRWDIWEIGSDGSNPLRLTTADPSTDFQYPLHLFPWRVHFLPRPRVESGAWIWTVGTRNSSSRAENGIQLYHPMGSGWFLCAGKAANFSGEGSDWGWSGG